MSESETVKKKRIRTRVLLVEDQRLVQQFLEDIVRNSERYELAASLRNADLADVYCEREQIDLILMDVYTAGGASGLNAAARIKKKHPYIRIIIITSMPEVSYLDRAREIGVESFWYKEVGDEPLLSVMDRTMEGESVYPDRTPEMQFGNISSYEFTERELEILRELTSGDTNEEIADRLFISKNTVKDYVTKMLIKTGFRSRTELAVKARELGLVVREEN
jgi:two-component system vancomycin resistance associated response regulator VraR